MPGSRLIHEYPVLLSTMMMASIFSPRFESVTSRAITRSHLDATEGAVHSDTNAHRFRNHHDVFQSIDVTES